MFDPRLSGLLVGLVCLCLSALERLLLRSPPGMQSGAGQAKGLVAQGALF